MKKVIALSTSTLLLAGLLSLGCEFEGKKKIADVADVKTADQQGEVSSDVPDPLDVPLDMERPGDVGSDTIEPTDTTPDLVPDALDVVADVDVKPDPCKGNFPLSGPCDGDESCTWGEECCCGECHPSMVCKCMDGEWGCYYTDACMMPFCLIPPCCQIGDDFSCDQYSPGEVCVPQPGKPYGKCELPVKYPSCWSQSDCKPGEKCDGVMMCPCDALCDGMDMPGQCVSKQLPPDCCEVDQDCDLGTDMAFVCVFAGSKELGVCKPLPSPGHCWEDKDCQQGFKCKGASVCPCDADCDMIDTEGVCYDPDPGNVGDICSPGQDDCKEGLVCCYPCGIQGCDWQCEEPCDPNEPGCAGGCSMKP